MRKFWFNLHLYGALASSLVIAVLCLTGTIMAFEDEIDAALNPGLFRVAPAGAHQPIATLAKAALALHADAKPIAITLPSSPTASLTVYVRIKSGIQLIFVNPYTGAILGERGQKTLLFQIHQLHTRLLTGTTGKTIIAVGTVLTIFLTITGIYLWWPLKRVTVKWSASARRIHFDLHHAVGILSAFFALIVAVTGIVISYEDIIVPAVYRWTKTPEQPRGLTSKPIAAQQPLTAEQAIAVAVGVIPGARPHNLNFISGPKGVYRVGMRFAEDLTPGGRSWVTLDQFSGKVLAWQNSRTAPAAAKLTIVNRALHNGDIFGVSSKILASLTCIAIFIQVITGFYLWWRKLSWNSSAATAD